MNTFCVYAHTKPDGAIFYIGKGTKRRPKDVRGRNTYWKNVVNKHGLNVIVLADNLTNDLNIIGINVINYYKISTVPVGQKMRISGSGNYISYTNTSTELNLRLLPLFTAGTGGLNFQGKISATRNA